MDAIPAAVKKYMTEKNISHKTSANRGNEEMRKPKIKSHRPPTKPNFSPPEPPEVEKIIELTEEVSDALSEDDEPMSLKSTKPSKQMAAKESKAVSKRVNIEKIDENLVSIRKPYSFETGLFKVLRGRISFPISGKPPRSILVTSAIPEDGKSFIASNLAVNMAQNIGEHVLLVDCDLRKPRIHTNFGFERVKGVSEHLSNGTKLPDLLLKTMVDKLVLLPAGAPPGNPSEILSSAKMAKLIDELKSRYADRYLIIDSPPPLLAPETIAIAKQVDGIIIVIKCGASPFHLVEEMINHIGKEKILGAVINQYDTPSSKYYGYKKYRKYYKKYNNR